MALKNTINAMRTLLEGICGDLEKSEAGNRAASQRVRTSSIKFAKISKLYRKESIAEERKGGKSGKKAKSTAKAANSKKAKAKPAARKK